MSTSDSEYGSRAAQVGAEYPTRDTWTFAELFNEENPAATEAKQWARDDADVNTTAGTPYGGVAPDRQVHKMQRDKD